MKKRSYVFGVLLVLFSLVLPTMSQAYFTTDQFAIRLDEGSVLYGITYDFGSNRYEYSMPIVPERRDVSEDQSRTLTYAVRDEDQGEVNYGETTGIVLSQADMKDGMYFIPRGGSRRFTLLVLLTGQDVPSEPLELALGVTNLPFIMVHTDGETNGQLNPPELRKYLTPYVHLSE